MHQPTLSILWRIRRRVTSMISLNTRIGLCGVCLSGTGDRPLGFARTEVFDTLPYYEVLRIYKLGIIQHDM
jgi:hypothetical protein